MTNINLDASVVALCIGFALVVLLVWRWQVDDSHFDLKQILVDSVTGKISIEKVAFMTALSVMTWGFVTLTLRDKMTEWYAMAYGGMFVLGRAFSQATSVWRDTTSKQAGEITPQGDKQ